MYGIHTAQGGRACACACALVSRASREDERHPIPLHCMDGWEYSAGTYIHTIPTYVFLPTRRGKVFGARARDMYQAIGIPPELT
jgi:hypothetical protein